MPKYTQTPPPQRIGAVIHLPEPPSKKASEYLTSHQGWVYSAVTAIARDVSAINLHLYKKKYLRGKLEIEEVAEHEAISLLHSVNEFMTFNQLIEITQTYLDLTGEAVWAILRSGQTPEQIWPLRPDWVKVKPSADKYIESYLYSPGGIYTLGQEVAFEPQDIIFMKYLNPVNPYRGKGAVQAASLAIDIDTYSSEWNRNFFYNSAIPYLFFTSPSKLSQEEIDRFMNLWQSRFSGRVNAHKIAFLGGGLDIKEVGAKPKEMDFLRSKQYNRDEILATFHVSKANLGIVEDVNRANQEASDARFLKKVIKPRMTSLVSYLNEFYLRNWTNEDLFFDFEDPVPADKDLDLTIYENGLKNGWLTINEVREKENLDPVEGGDQIYLPFNLQPIGGITGGLQRLFSKKSEEERGVLTLPVIKSKKAKYNLTLPIPPKKLRQLRKDQIKKEIKHDLIKLVVGLMNLKNGKKAKKSKKTTSEIKETIWKQMVAKTDVQEQAMIKILKNLFYEQQKEVTAKVENKSYPKHIKASANSFLFDLFEQNRKWLSILLPFIKDIIFEKSRETFDFLGMGGSIDLSQKRAAQFLKTDGVAFIKSANETTRNKLKDELAEGLLKGESIDELKNRVEKIFENAIGPRSEMIARSEVLRATNFATEETYRQSGVVEGKEWLTALDERTCPFCQEMDGKIVDVSENYFDKGDIFNVGGEKLDISYSNVAYPPLHISCRCTLIPVIATKQAKPQKKEISLEKVYQKVLAKEAEDLEKHNQRVIQETEKAEAELKIIQTKKEKAKEIAKEIKEVAKAEAQVVKEIAIEEAEEEKKGILNEIKKLRDKARDLIYGSK